ncbi:MAG TPA: hypothetical protein VKA84_27555 [Gemmatimonadaceae bacterium]|nr:hypothetical protein [Gemmatimonadaceae bacterium]
MTPPAQPRRAPRYQTPGGGLRGALAGAALGTVLALAGWGVVRAAHGDVARETGAAIRQRFGPWAMPAVLVLTVLSAWLVIAWHELGHLIAGAMARLRFRTYILGPLRVERDVSTGRVVARFNRELGTWGGMAGSYPTDARDLSRRVAMLLAGGPLASLVLAAVAFGALAALRTGPITRGLVAVTGLFSLGIGAVTLLPMRGSDGGRLLRLRRGGPAAEREAAVFGILGLLTSGARPRDWPPALADTAVAVPDDSTEDALATLLAYEHVLDVRDYARAERLTARLAEIRDALPAALRGPAALEEAFVEAHIRRNPARARALLAAIPTQGTGIRPGARARVEAAVAFAEGDAARGRTLMQQAIADSPAAMPYTRTVLEELLGEMEATLGASPVN